MIQRALRSVFDFFASLRLAIFLIVTLGITLAAGTIIESLHGAKAAQQLIYYSTPFNIFLFILGVNVAFAALDRLPWQRKHIGFLLTHAGIILILCGSWMTHKFSLEGQLALAEGEKGDRITLDEPLLRISIPDSLKSSIVSVEPTPFPWEGKRTVPLQSIPGLRVNVLAYYPHAEAVERVVEKEGGHAAAEIFIFNDNMKTGGWIVAGTERDRVDLGPASIRITNKTSEEEKTDPKGSIVVLVEEKEVEIPVSEASQKHVKIEGTPYELKVTRFLPHAVVADGKLINQSDEPVNPAAEVVIEGNGIREAHTVFAQFPDFPTIHGLKEGASGLRLHMHFSAENAANELRIIRKEQGLFYQLKTRGIAAAPVPVEIGQEVATGWMNLKFVVNDFKPEAEYRFAYEPRPMPPAGKSPAPAALFAFEKGEARKEVWMTSGQKEIFFVKDLPLQVTYGNRMVPLGFELKLKDFMIDFYPGSTKPAAFKSSVTLEDGAQGLMKDTIISMNEPLQHRGFKIYQSGYQLGGESEVSVFQVGRDPGIPVKYTGSIVMISGILIMFYMKRFSNPKPVYVTN